MNAKSKFEIVADAWETIMWSHEDFRLSLGAIANKNSPLDMRYLREFYAETDAARDAAIEELFAAHGWTEDDFLACCAKSQAT